MNKTKARNLLKLFLKISFTAILLYFVLKKINFTEIKNIFKTSDPFFIALAFIFFFLSQIASSWRLLSFLKRIGLPLQFWFNFRLYLLGMFYNIFLPGGIGGDGYKIYLLRKKYSISARKIFNAIFFDRLSGLWALAFLAAIFLFFISEKLIPLNAAIIIFLAGTLLYYFIIKKYFTVFIQGFITNHLKAIVVQALQVVCVAFILSAIHFRDSYWIYLFIFLISSIVAVIPFTIGGLGAREYVMIYSAVIFHIDKNIGVFISATFWLISALTSLTGVYYVYNSKEFTAPPAGAKLKND